MNLLGKLITPLAQVFWPPLSPVPTASSQINDYRRWWRLLCVLTTIPITAVLHHAIFFRSQCMLNPFFATDYTSASILIWLSRDPSLPWAAVAAMTIYYLGTRHSFLRVCIAPVFVSFLPLSLWIWDVPFTGRFICHHLHDEKILLMSGIPLRSWFFYLLGAILYVVFAIYLLHRRKNDQLNRVTTAMLLK